MGTWHRPDMVQTNHWLVAQFERIHVEPSGIKAMAVSHRVIGIAPMAMRIGNSMMTV